MNTEIKETAPGELYIKSYGRFDLDTSKEAGADIRKKIEESSVSTITWDFADVTYVSSFGLKVILDIYQKLKEPAKVNIVNASVLIKRSFMLVGFEKFLNIS